MYQPTELLQINWSFPLHTFNFTISNQYYNYLSALQFSWKKHIGDGVKVQKIPGLFKALLSPKPRISENFDFSLIYNFALRFSYTEHCFYNVYFEFEEVSISNSTKHKQRPKNIVIIQ